MKNEERIRQDKHLRVEIQGLIDRLDCSSEERAIARQKLREARHWLGEDLAASNVPNPYPNGNDPTTTKVDPPTDQPPTHNQDTASAAPDEKGGAL